MKIILRILVGLAALIFFVPVLLIALAHDVIHLAVAGMLYVFGNSCSFAANTKKITFVECLDLSRIKE